MREREGVVGRTSRKLERKDEHEGRSGTDNMDDVSGNDQVAANNPPRKKRYHRHTPQQIQELEAYDLMFHKSFSLFLRQVRVL